MTNVNAEETNDEVSVTQKRVSERIQKVLESEGYGLQPFMQYSEFGIIPRVRLVAVSKTNDTDGQEDNQGDAGEPQAEDGASPAEQS